MAVTPGSTISSRGVSPTPASSNPFGVAPSMTSISPQPSSLGLSGLRSSPVPPNPMLGMVPPGMGLGPMSMGMGAPGMGLGLMQASPMGLPYSGHSPLAPTGSALLGPGGAVPPQPILGVPAGTGGMMGAGGSMGGATTTGASTNPFLLWGSVTITLPTCSTLARHTCCPHHPSPPRYGVSEKKTNVYISIFKKKRRQHGKKIKKMLILGTLISFQINFLLFQLGCLRVGNRDLFIFV